jgi:hypothetical protein
LLLPTSCEGVSITPFVSPWGETEELLCSVAGTLVGQVTSDDRRPGTNVIVLLPKLDQKRAYPFPSPREFRQALLKLLCNAPQARLICEGDADQKTMRQLASVEDVEAALDCLMAYCEGQTVECPSFSYSRP